MKKILLFFKTIWRSILLYFLDFKKKLVLIKDRKCIFSLNKHQKKNTILFFSVFFLSLIFGFAASCFSANYKIEQVSNSITATSLASISNTTNFAVYSKDEEKPIDQWHHFCTVESNNHYLTYPFEYFITYNAFKDKSMSKLFQRRFLKCKKHDSSFKILSTNSSS